MELPVIRIGDKVRLDGNTRHEPATVVYVGEADKHGYRDIGITTCHNVGLVVANFRLEVMS